MTGEERRARLFKKSRPHIRPLEGKDMGWLWAAYKAGSFSFPEELSQEQFAEHMRNALQGQRNYLVEDDSRRFSSGRGPVALIGEVTDGERIEPAVAIFKWATLRNVLRGFVAYFQWVKYRPITECVVRAEAKDKLMKKMVDYGVIYPRKVETVYGVRGKNDARRAA